MIISNEAAFSVSELVELIALAGSLLVNIILAFVTFYQVRTERKTRTMEKYIQMQRDAYFAFFDKVAAIDSGLTSIGYKEFLAAAYQAMTVSPHTIAKTIEDFCAIYLEHHDHPENEALKMEFKQSLTAMATLLREELFRFDTMKRKSDKFFNDKKSKDKKSKQNH